MQSSARTASAPVTLSVVVPVLDEEACIAELAERVRRTAAEAGVEYELLFVDDGSTDATPQRIAEQCEASGAVRCLRLTRPFGHQAALAAGLAFASGDVVATMDGDLQHPPETLPAMLEAWRAGADVVHTTRRDPRGAEGFWKRTSSRLFYRGMQWLGVPVIPAGADFRLMDRRVVDQFNTLEEHFVFVRGLVPWLGYPHATVGYDVEPRHGGRSKYGAWRMLRLAMNGVFSFTVLPLRLITVLGLGITLLGTVYGVYALIAYLGGRVSDSGWTSLMGVVLIFGGVQLLSIGIVSEYIGRVYEEVKRRPRYVVESKRGLE